MENRIKTALWNMDIIELRQYLKNIDLNQTKSIYVRKRSFIVFEKYYVHITTQEGKVLAIPFHKKNKEEIKRDVFSIKTLLNFRKVSKNHESGT